MTTGRMQSFLTTGILAVIAICTARAVETAPRLAVDGTQFERRLAEDPGTLRVCLRNESGQPVTIDRVSLDDEPLSEEIFPNVLHHRPHRKTHSVAPISNPDGDPRVLWCSVEPTVVADKSVALVTLKFARLPIRPVKLTVYCGEINLVDVLVEDAPSLFVVRQLSLTKDRLYVFLQNHGRADIDVADLNVNGRNVQFAGASRIRASGGLDVLTVDRAEFPHVESLLIFQANSTSGRNALALIRSGALFDVSMNDKLRREHVVVKPNKEGELIAAFPKGDPVPIDADRKDNSVIYCPTHAYESFQAAASEILWQRAGKVKAGHLGVWCCKTEEVDGLLRFAEIADFVTCNPIQPARFGAVAPWLSTRSRTEQISAAAGFTPWFASVPSAVDPRYPEYQSAPPTPAQIEQMIWISVGSGAKSIYLGKPAAAEVRIALEPLENRIKGLAPILETSCALSNVRATSGVDAFALLTSDRQILVVVVPRDASPAKPSESVQSDPVEVTVPLPANLDSSLAQDLFRPDAKDFSCSVEQNVAKLKFPPPREIRLFMLGTTQPSPKVPGLT